jgi:hypothetical protein
MTMTVFAEVWAAQFVVIKSSGVADANPAHAAIAPARRVYLSEVFMGPYSWLDAVIGSSLFAVKRADREPT